MSYSYLNNLIENHRFIPNVNELTEKFFKSQVVFNDTKEDKNNLLHTVNTLIELLQTKVEEDISFSIHSLSLILNYLPINFIDDISSKILDSMKTYLKTTDLDRQFIALKVYCKLFEQMNNCSNSVLHELSPKCKEILYILMDNIRDTKNVVAIQNNLRCLSLVIHLLKTSIKSIISNIEERIILYLDHFDDSIRYLTAICLADTYLSDKTNEYFVTKYKIILNTFYVSNQIILGKPYETTLTLLPLPMDPSIITMNLNNAIHRCTSLFTLLSRYLSQPFGLMAPVTIPLSEILNILLPSLAYYVPIADRTIDISLNGTALPPNQQVLYIEQMNVSTLDFMRHLVLATKASLYPYSSVLIRSLSPFLDRIFRDTSITVILHTLQFLNVLYSCLPPFYKHTSSSLFPLFLNIINQHTIQCEHQSIIISDQKERKAQNKNKSSKVNIYITNSNDMKVKESSLVNNKDIDFPCFSHTHFNDVLQAILNLLSILLNKASIYITLEERQQLDVLLWTYIHQYLNTSYYTKNQVCIFMDPISILRSIIQLVQTSIMSPYPNGYLSPLLSLSIYIFTSISAITTDEQVHTLCLSSIQSSYLLLHSPAPHIWIHSNIPTKIEYTETIIKETQINEQITTGQNPISSSTKPLLPSSSLGNKIPLPVLSLPNDSIFFSNVYMNPMKRERELYEQELNNNNNKKIKIDDNITPIQTTSQEINVSNTENQTKNKNNTLTEGLEQDKTLQNKTLSKRESNQQTNTYSNNSLNTSALLSVTNELNTLPVQTNKTLSSTLETQPTISEIESTLVSDHAESLSVQMNTNKIDDSINVNNTIIIENNNKENNSIQQTISKEIRTTDDVNTSIPKEQFNNNVITPVITPESTPVITPVITPENTNSKDVIDEDQEMIENIKTSEETTQNTSNQASSTIEPSIEDISMNIDDLELPDIIDE